jgi:hypothetical protein
VLCTGPDCFAGDLQPAEGWARSSSLFLQISYSFIQRENDGKKKARRSGL